MRLLKKFGKSSADFTFLQQSCSVGMTLKKLKPLRMENTFKAYSDP